MKRPAANEIGARLLMIRFQIDLECLHAGCNVAGILVKTRLRLMNRLQMPIGVLGQHNDHLPQFS